MLNDCVSDLCNVSVRCCIFYCILSMVSLLSGSAIVLLLAVRIDVILSVGDAGCTIYSREMHSLRSSLRSWSSLINPTLFSRSVYDYVTSW